MSKGDFIKKFRLQAIIILSLSFSAVMAPASAENQTIKDLQRKEALFSAQNKAIGWIKAQMVPNAVVSEPAPERRRFLLSYRVPEEDPAYPYIYSRSFLYDNALGVVALTMTGEYHDAEYILSAIRRQLRADGSLWFVYNTHNSWPSEEDRGGALIRTGALAWFGYSIIYYLRVRLLENDNFLNTDILARGYLEMAESIASYILSNQVKEPGDRRFGLITGGWGDYEIKIDRGTGTPVEEYFPSKVSWVSMEHNIDIYFFLKDLYSLTGKEKYREGAELVKNGVLGLWSDEYGQFYRGIKATGMMDTALPLDGASWGTLFLLSIGEDEKAARCLQTFQGLFISKHGRIKGYRPYVLESVYEDERINSYYYPEHPRMLWKDLPFVWGEGSCGAAAALIRCGKIREGAEVLNSMLLLRVGDGFRYASGKVPYQFNDYPCVATTAWFVIAVELLKGGRAGIIFWD
ncbi:MAG: hypothetical protein ACUVWJ_10330 [Spirochaetota bacterium]